MIIADTDVLIDYVHGKGEADTIEDFLVRGVLRTTVITRFELLSGARTPKQIARIQQLLEAIPCLSLDDEAADSASQLRRSLARAGEDIGMADSLIAGIVLSAGASLFTRNKRHFERVPGIVLA